MKTTLNVMLITLACGMLLTISGCGEDNNEANQQLIGGECTALEDCDDGDPETPELECIQDFKGGYCGRMNCEQSGDCPEGSLCADVEGTFYCFLVCIDKLECNQNRTLENESNCSSSIDPVEGGEEKLCIPPTGS